MDALFFEQVVQRAPVALVGVDATGVVRYLNVRSHRLLPTLAAGRPLSGVVRAEQRADLDAFLASVVGHAWDPSTFTATIAGAGDAVRVVELTATNLLALETVRLILLSVCDVSRAVQREEELSALSLTDALTGLANRTQFVARLAGQSGTDVAATVVFLDLDTFKAVNDLHGHEGGDQVLQVVAARLTASMPDGSTVSRFGGDEFAALLPGLTPEQAAPMVRAALEAVAAPLTLPAGPVNLTASAGLVAVDPAAPERALAQADQAMYRAKAFGRGQLVTHGPELEDWLTGRRDVLRRMMDLQVQNRRLRLESRTDSLTGLGNDRAMAEALVRLEATHERSRQPYALLCVRVDGFSAYNRAYGATAGDTVLARVAVTLVRTCRAADAVYRTSGGEMVVLLADSGPERAQIVAERVRAAVEALGIPHRANASAGVVTATVGLGCSAAGRSLSAVLAGASEAAHAAKEADRRNAVVRG